MASGDKQEQDPSWLEHLHFELMGAASLLSVATEPIKRLDLNQSENIQRIETALSNVYEIAADIYDIRPDLKPSWVSPEWDKPDEAHKRNPEDQPPRPPIPDGDNDISPDYDRLNSLLSGATQHLSSAAGWVRDTRFRSRPNIHKIGETLVTIFTVSEDLYVREPRLIPLFLRDTKKWKHYFE